ncbi:TPA: hypothetical protein PXM37_004361, partial [Yersinia enterocolitica]|nr:hypothetical protein [Yersinia enterocolitica]HDL6985376.1 hypothetical protein [Yersinia enterocolitica]HDL7067917.1 hypothetical protein [Yersinia enterocolitica]HDL7072309.1 hypothetical protein [Yersinia enterocolitica]
VNGHTFAVDAGFPHTGFTGAEFTLNAPGPASDYTWSSSSTWATVDGAGKVRFTQKGNAAPVTITATPTAGGDLLSYTFTVTDWFIHNGSTLMNWRDAANWCTSQGATQPTVAKLKLSLDQNTRGVGSLWSEWGRMDNYHSSSGFYSDIYWSSESHSTDTYYSVYLYNGDNFSGYESINNAVVCLQSL